MSRRDRLSLNQATVKYASLDTAMRVAIDERISGIGIWREAVAEVGLSTAARLLRNSGLQFTSLCRGGFFTSPDGLARRSALEENRRAIGETARLCSAGAQGSTPVLVLVAGGLPAGSTDLAGARARVADALDVLTPTARDAGVVLAIEALHPMYASDRAVVSTLDQALDLAEPFDPAQVGVVIDTFHTWWDPHLYTAIQRAGEASRIAAFQVCDWLTPIAADPLLSRGLMGDGNIDFRPIVRAVENAGYGGPIEVEIFNMEIWNLPPHDVARRVTLAFQRHVDS